MSDDRCARCGEDGEDRRTLWMACFYAMEELRNVPFERCAIRGLYMAHLGDDDSRVFPGVALPQYEVAEAAETRIWPFYTLRVCKDCRAEWMEAIEGWFVGEKRIGRETGTGIYVRRNGATVEATEAEVQRMTAALSSKARDSEQQVGSEQRLDAESAEQMNRISPRGRHERS